MMNKRVQFSTLSTSVGDGGALNSTTPATKNGLLTKKGKSPETNADELCPRFEIKLDDSLTDGCPEFSYKELIERSRADHDLPDDPDSVRERAEEESMRKLAKSMEAKYGTANKKKRTYKRQHDDYIDKGYGYDEDDSFIDNEEAYDELIPSTLTTKYGGFYINCGKLEFRPCSDAEEDEVLNENEDDDSREFRNATKKRKHASGSQSKNKRKKRMIESDDESQENSREEDLNSEDESDEESDSSSSSNDSQQQPSQPSQQQQLTQSQQQQQPPKAKSKKANTSNNAVKHQTSIDSIIDSVLNSSGKGSKATNSSIKVGATIDLTNDEPHRIPDDYPDSIKEKLTKLKEFGSSQANKKSRTYIDEENKYLFEIDNLLQACSSSVRNSVNAWLLAYLNLSKTNQLSKRINNVRRPFEESKLKQYISNLRMEVSYVIEDNEDYQATVRQWEEDKRNGLDVGDKPDDLGFKFNDKIRDLLRKILNSKRIMVSLDSIRGKSEEDNITNFFNNEIKNIWPPNWISNSTLLRTAGFISKYSQTADPAKSSVSVISSKKASPPLSRPTDNNQPLNLNVPKTSQPQPPTNSSSFNNVSPSNSNAAKVHAQQKDLSIEKPSKHHDKASSSSKPESLLKKQQQQQQQQHDASKSKSHHHQSKSAKEDGRSFLKDQMKVYKREIADTTHLAISLGQPNNSAAKLANLEMQRQFSQQQLIKEQNLKLLAAQQQLASQQAKSASSQANKSSSPYDKTQNLTNYVPAHSSSSLNNAATNRPANFSSATANHTTAKKLFEQHSQFSQPQQKLSAAAAAAPKQSINKSLEVDFNIDKAIKKSLIEDHQQQQQQQSLQQQITHQLQRSNSLSNNSGGGLQKQPNLTPKPAHSNSSNSQPNLTLQQQLLLQQLNNMAMQQYQEAMKKMQQSGSISPNDLSSNLNSRNSFPNFTNAGNNQIQTQPISNPAGQTVAGQLSATGQQLNNSQLGKISTGSQVFGRNAVVVQSSPNVPTINTVPSIVVPSITVSNIATSVSPNQVTNPNQISSQISSQISGQMNSSAQFSNQLNSPNQISNPMLAKSELNSLLSNQSAGSVRYSSPTASNSNASIGQYTAAYQAAPELASQVSGSLQKSNVYADYMSLSPQIQQQIQQQYQRNIQQQQQRQDDFKRK